MNVTRPLALAAVLLAACAESQPYPSSYREASFADGRTVMIIGARLVDVCEAIADRTCDPGPDVDVVPGCHRRMMDRCGRDPSRIESASDEAWHRDWWRCLYAIDDTPGRRWGTTRPRECAVLTPFWRPIPVT